MNTPPTVRILVVDPQPLFRYGLKKLLDETDHFRVVEEADDSAQAVQRVRQCQVDLLVINPGIGGGGLDALTGLDDLPKPVHCIVVTNGSHAYSPPASRGVRIAGVLSRHAPASEFVSCIEDVIRNQQTEDPEAAAALNVSLNRTKAPYGLTPRESQITCAVASCASNKDIAAQLSIAEDTVKHHLSSIFNKVGVDSRLELAIFALYHGIADWS